MRPCSYILLPEIPRDTITPMPRLMADPHDNVKLTALRVVRFQKTDNKKTTDKDGAIKPKYRLENIKKV